MQTVDPRADATDAGQWRACGGGENGHRAHCARLLTLIFPDIIMEFLLQLAIILACLFYGARKGGMALGLLGGIGIVLLAFVFRRST
jgi:hypothetical protein